MFINVVSVMIEAYYLKIASKLDFLLPAQMVMAALWGSLFIGSSWISIISICISIFFALYRIWKTPLPEEKNVQPEKNNNEKA